MNQESNFRNSKPVLVSHCTFCSLLLTTIVLSWFRNSRLPSPTHPQLLGFYSDFGSTEKTSKYIDLPSDFRISMYQLPGLDIHQRWFIWGCWTCLHGVLPVFVGLC